MITASLATAGVVHSSQDHLDNRYATANASGPLNLSLVPFASGFTGPLGVIGADDGRIFVLEQAGVIKIVQPNGTVLTTPFLDIQSRVDSSSNEEGLLGMALDPDFANNGYFYLNYINSDPGRHSRISRFNLTGPNVANPGSEEILLTIDQPNSNHNAGHILFGPDGYLYIPMGDGGGSGDSGNLAQNPANMLGKIIRIDVSQAADETAECWGDGTGNYAVPISNPFVAAVDGSCDEIWAIGVRNPWQSSFDRATGDFYIGDVGQNAWEEINFQPAASTGGENYGWRCYEGNHPFNTGGCASADNYNFPIFEYPHPQGCSVTGGYVYRGSQFPDMIGHYIFTDYCQGVFWDLVPDGSGGWTSNEHSNLAAFGYSAFGESSDGELYVANIGDGILYHLQEENAPPPPADSVCVEDIILTLLNLKSNRGAEAEILVTDCVGNTVSAANVSGAWETPANPGPQPTSDETTDTTGIAISLSPTVRKKDGGQFTYFVSDVFKSGLTYDASNSVESACINTDGSSCVAEPPPPPPPPNGSDAHVFDLSGESSSSSGNKWNASITVQVHDNIHQDYSNVTVSGTWSNGATGSGSCLSDDNGICTITKNNLKARAGNSVSFTVNDISDASGSIYNSNANEVNMPSIDIPKPVNAR